MGKIGVTEEWRDVPGYDGRYQVSNLGNIRSVPYTLFQPSSHAGVMTNKHYPGKTLRPTGNGNGYLIVGLRCRGEKRKNSYVHRLVAEAFIPNPDGLKEVNHVDYNKSNNAAYNLEWVSRKGNIDWSRDHMMKPKKNARLTNIGMRYISIRGGRYRFSVYSRCGGRCFDKCFDTLEEAIRAREEFFNAEDREHIAG